jgi:hypothetical protein
MFGGHKCQKQVRPTNPAFGFSQTLALHDTTTSVIFDWYIVTQPLTIPSQKFFPLTLRRSSNRTASEPRMSQSRCTYAVPTSSSIWPQPIVPTIKFVIRRTD